MTITRRQLFAAPALLLQPKTAPERPNVLFIGSDDLNNVIGCYGHPVVRTPNLDALAAAGTRFDHAYCQFPLCGPSRSSLLSGRRPETTQVWGNGPNIRASIPDVVTLPQFFRRAGWHSLRAGKMYHMDVPFSVGTNKYDDPESWDVSVSPPGLEDKSPGEGRAITRDLGPGNNFEYTMLAGPGDGQADNGAAELAIETIGKRQTSPWFIGLGFVRPHVPFVAPARFFDLYPLSKLEPVTNPANDRDDIPRASEIAIGTRANDAGLKSDQDKREALRGYYASISYMDWNVGRVLDRLEKTGQRRRTIVVFWSDHGWHLGEHFRWQKRSLFEEASRVPLIVSAPGQRTRGKAARGLVELVDLYPTIASLCGFRPPENLEGQSFRPLLDNPSLPFKKAAFTMVTAGRDNREIIGRAVRTERWRYIRWTGPEPGEELYDQRNDPREFTNLAANPAHAATLASMRGVLNAGWRAARA
mgnify:CR=1 FL=1